MKPTDYFNATFYDRYTALTPDEIKQKLTPVPKAESGCAVGYEGKEITIVLDNGPTLEYAFSEDKLTLKENGAEAIEAPYSARKLNNIVLLTHMIPETFKGYNLIINETTNLVTVFEVWFCGFEPDNREVWRQYYNGYIKTDAEAPVERHTLTNRIEGTGTHWCDDNGTEMLYFFPSVVWSSFVELSNPRCGVTITAPSDYLKIDDTTYIYSRSEQEFGGGFSLEVIDMFTIKHIGVRLAFNLQDDLVYAMYSGKGEYTGRSTNLEPLTDYGTEIPYSDAHAKEMFEKGKGARPSYRPRFMHKDYTQEEVDEIIRTNCKVFEGRSIMSSRNTMEVTDYMNGFEFTLRYDDGPAWEYKIIDSNNLKWRAVGEEEWHEEKFKGYEAAKDIVIFAHICTGSKPLRCLTHAIDFSNSLVTCVDAHIGNGRKPWQVGHEAIFGVLQMEGAPEPPVIRRHSFTNELVGNAFAWTYGAYMQSIHVYSTPESYSWTIIMPNNTGGWMWSSPCFYVKLRDDAYLMSWTEDDCNGNQGTFVVNPWIMHDSGFFFGVGDTEEIPDVHLHEMGAFARPLAGFDLNRFFEQKQK